jgi:hypothetical protein
MWLLRGGRSESAANTFFGQHALLLFRRRPQAYETDQGNIRSVFRDMSFQGGSVAWHRRARRHMVPGRISAVHLSAVEVGAEF